MARSGRHAAADGSFGRSVRGAALRGTVLLAIAVVLGIVLLQSADDNDAFEPVRSGSGGDNGESVAATTVVERTTTTARPLRPPAQVKVLAVNGTTIRGLAGQFNDRIRAAGYNALAPTDATKKPNATSAVYFTAGYEAEARVLAEVLEIATVAAMPSPPPVANLQSANLVVLVGTDNAPATATTRPRASTATTVARTATTRAATTTTRG